MSSIRTICLIVLALLVATDLGFIFLFGLLGIGVISDEGFTLTYDRSYAEVFQYVKIYWLILLLLGMACVRRSLVCAALGSIFCFMLLDDYAMLHETWGEALAEQWNLQPMWMLKGYDFGELFVLGGYTLASCAILAAAYLRANVAERRLVWDTFRLLVVLGIFVVGVDLLHALALPELISNCIGAAEDGGEMLAVSLLVGRLLYEACVSPSDERVKSPAASLATRKATATP